MTFYGVKFVIVVLPVSVCLHTVGHVAVLSFCVSVLPLDQSLSTIVSHMRAEIMLHFLALSIGSVTSPHKNV